MPSRWEGRSCFDPDPARPSEREAGRSFDESSYCRRPWRASPLPPFTTSSFSLVDPGVSPLLCFPQPPAFHHNSLLISLPPPPSTVLSRTLPTSLRELRWSPRPPLPSPLTFLHLFSSTCPRSTPPSRPRRISSRRSGLQRPLNHDGSVSEDPSSLLLSLPPLPWVSFSSGELIQRLESRGQGRTRTRTEPHCRLVLTLYIFLFDSLFVSLIQIRSRSYGRNQ